MAKIGKYIYGIINSNGEDFSCPNGVTCKGVNTIPYQDISAVVSDSEIIDYTLLRKEALARELVKYQQIIEEIMPAYAIIPMRLGTFVSDGNEVREILIRGYRVIKDIFSKIIDKIEIDVAATWSDFNSILKEIGEEKEIKELKDKILANSKEIPVDDRMKVGLMVKKALDKKRDGCALEIQNALKTMSEDLKAHELMDDKMVMNAAFLIRKASHNDFEKKTEELNTEFAEKLNFRCVGPLPPYSFYTLEIKRMRGEEIDWAKKKLSLNEFINKNEIKKAYQRAAFFYHPDKNLDTPDMGMEFNEVARAYKILVDYGEACEQAGHEDNFLLKGEEFKRSALLVKVRD